MAKAKQLLQTVAVPIQEEEVSGTIRVKVPQLLKKRKIQVMDFMYGARLAPGTAYDLANEDAANKKSGIDYKTLARLCDFFGVAVGDLLEFVPDEK